MQFFPFSYTVRKSNTHYIFRFGATLIYIHWKAFILLICVVYHCSISLSLALDLCFRHLKEYQITNDADATLLVI